MLPFLRAMWWSTGQAVLGSPKYNVAGDHGNAEGPNSFVVYLQVFNDITAATLKSIGRDVYPVRVFS